MLRGGLVFRAQILLYHSTFALNVIKKETKKHLENAEPAGFSSPHVDGIQELPEERLWYLALRFPLLLR